MTKRNAAYFGRGLVFNKYTGARGKSGSNDANAEYVGYLRNIMDNNNVSFQTAELGKVDQGGGGTGQTFDWSLIPEIDRPFFLAGGLGADNLETAVRTIHPYAVDLSSSVETDGMKDRDKILKAVQLVHIK